MNRLPGIAKVTLTVVAGPDRGKKVSFSEGDLFVGRDTQNHLVLTDPKSSRNHFVIRHESQGIVLRKRSKAKSVTLNNQELEKARLNDKDIIQIGNNEILVTFQEIDLARIAQQAPETQPVTPKRTPRSRKSGFKVPWVALAGIGILLFWLLSSSPQPKESLQVLTEDDVQKLNEESLRRQEALLKKRALASIGDKQAQWIADKEFNKGLRDYKSGNFMRALSAFETALAAQPRHELANRYKKLALDKREEMIEKDLKLAHSYLGKTMYRLCKNHAEKVLQQFLRPAPENSKYSEATNLYNECHLLTEDH